MNVKETKMEVKHIYKLIFSSLILISCGLNKDVSKDITGVYLQKDNKRIELHLNNNTFVIKDNFKPSHLAIEEYKCCDTIAYGNWKKENDFLSFSSPKELSTFYLNTIIKEETVLSNDSVIFVIDNPIERSLKKENKNSRDLYYSIDVGTKSNGIISKKSNSNVFKIKNVKGINKIEITIYPSIDINLRSIANKEFYTLPYEVKNTNTNIYNIDIPKLNYGYLSYKRLNNDYVKVISKDKLLWEGKEYIKQ